MRILTPALIAIFVVLAPVNGRGDDGRASITSAYVLPTAATTRPLLEGAVHTSEFVDVAAGRARLTAFVSYPDRGERAPAVVVTTDEGMTDWARSLAFQAARAGFVAIAPDYSSQASTRAQLDGVLTFAARLPAANGLTAALDVRGDVISARAGACACRDLRAGRRRVGHRAGVRVAAHRQPFPPASGHGSRGDGAARPTLGSRSGCPSDRRADCRWRSAARGARPQREA